MEAYKATAKNLSNWLKENHPEIKEIREITPEHIQEWINDRATNWSVRTLENHLSRIKYMEEQAQRAYPKSKIEFYKDDLTKPETKASQRNKMMDKSDFERLREAMSRSRSYAKDAIEISYRCGLRVNEVACLKREDIDLENRTIHVSREGAKNGRERYVPIRDKDTDYFKGLLEKHPEDGYLSKISPDAINRAIGRALDKLEDAEGHSLDEKYKGNKEHAIRKLYATERMREERGNLPLTDHMQEMKCWDTVSKELGHGAGREALYKTYCKG